MLYNLRVENIALIDKLNIEFGEGLNILSGETGAGKSIIINSMNLILGERADRDLIRTGCEKAKVEAIFYIDYEAFQKDLEELGIEKSDELIVSRELSVSGKNICRINGNAVNLNGLKKLMTKIVDIHSQHSNQMLLNQANHINLLDSFLSGDIIELKHTISQHFKRLRLLNRKLIKLGGSSDKRAREIDLLKFRINEGEELALDINELKTLEQEQERLINAQKISDALRDCYSILYMSENERSVAGSLNICDDKLSQISEYSEEYEKALIRLRDYLYGIEDLAHELNGYMEDAFTDDERMDEISERKNLIKDVFRKYNIHTEEEYIDFIDSSKEKLNELLNSDKEIETLNIEIRKEREILDKLYAELTKSRKEAAQELEKMINSELNDLGMTNSQFSVSINKDETYKYKENGIDTVEFFISTNLGDPPKPLSKIASGGEVSRIMLALKNVFRRSDRTSTLIFDEIDTGISGEIALIVADKIASIALNKQVICVSHLPQIAAMGDKNFLIEKTVDNGATYTKIKELNNEGLINEIARLSGGIKSEKAADHAVELRENAQRYKRKLQERQTNV